MGQDVNTDWQATPLSGATALQQANIATAGVPGSLQSNQAQQTQEAFHNMDVGDPDSVNSAFGALLRAGATDQAKAVQDLSFQRWKIAGQQSGASALDTALAAPSSGVPAAAPAPAAPSPAPSTPGLPSGPLTPAQQAKQQAVMGFADQSLQALRAIQDPEARAVSAQAVREHAQELGVPDQFIDAALGDLSDAHLGEMDANFQQVLQHPAYGGQGDAGPVPLHAATIGAMNHPDSLTNPDVLRAVTGIAAHGGDTTQIQAAISAAMGFQGPVSPGQRVVQNGEQTVGPTYGQVNPAPGSRVFNADTGAPIVTGDANPAPAVVQAFGPAETPLIVKPTQGTANLIPSGGSGTPPTPAGDAGGGAASPPHPGYQPTVSAASVLPAVQAHPAQYLSGILGVPVKINSLERSPEHNADVGGSPTSEHIPGNGFAADFDVPAGMTHDQVAQKFLAAGIPFDQLIFEKNGSGHIGWGLANGGPQRGQVLDRTNQAQASAAPTGGAGDGMMHGKMVSAPFHPPGTPPGAMFTQAPDGSLSPVAGTVAGALDVGGAQASAAVNPQVQQAQHAIQSYKNVAANIATASGPAIVSILGDLSGNTGAPPKDIIQSFGLPQQWIGNVEGFGGSGKLTPAMRQQAADAVYSHVQSTYAQAQQFNAQRAGDEQQGGLRAGALQAALPAAPPQYYITAPPKSAETVGKTIQTPKGVFTWSGTGWRPTTQTPS
jgi:hypothetical protein